MASTVVAQKLSQIQGVGQVIVGGGALPSVRVDVESDAARQLRAHARRRSDGAEPAERQSARRGSSPTATSPPTSSPTTRSRHAEDYKPLVVGYKNGAAVRLSDVADGDRLGPEHPHRRLPERQARAIPIIVFRQPGANIIATVDRIRAQMPFLEASIPRGIHINVVLDRTTTIRASVSDVERTLLISVGAGHRWWCSSSSANARATLDRRRRRAGLADRHLRGHVPVRVQLDNLSLMALTISTGFVVDDAIVVMENITRHLEAGMKPVRPR